MCRAYTEDTRDTCVNTIYEELNKAISFFDIAFFVQKHTHLLFNLIY